jgi:hypothetical protein
VKRCSIVKLISATNAGPPPRDGVPTLADDSLWYSSTIRDFLRVYK